MAAVVLVAGLVGGGAGIGGAYAVLGSTASSPQLAGNAPVTAASTGAAGSPAGAAAIASPSTVDIRVSSGETSTEGSGVVLSADGAVLTNNHVVGGGAGRITVTLADGTEHRATVVGTAPSYDLAVLRVDGVSGLTPATLGRTADVEVGQQVVAIGSPRGLTGTVTMGIVSALDRTVQVQGDNGQTVVYNGLQTDAPINQGNSGGPLVNLDGQVVGINSAIATTGAQSGSIGLGFAIPVDQARRVAQEIIDTGTATTPVLGVHGTAAEAGSTATGALVSSVQDGSPAAGAGIVAGDTVLRVGTDRVENVADLVARIRAAAPGDTVELAVRDPGGSERTVQVTLGSAPDEAAGTAEPGRSAAPFGPGSPFGDADPFGR